MPACCAAAPQRQARHPHARGLSNTNPEHEQILSGIRPPRPARLPHSYTLSSWQAFAEQRRLNVQAGTRFCDASLQAEVASGRLRASSLDVFASVALAGVAAEWLRFGVAEGGVGDVRQLDALLRALGFTQAKADGEVRWAVLNTVTLLRRHEGVHDAATAAMQRGESVARVIAVIEAALAGAELV